MLQGKVLSLVLTGCNHVASNSLVTHRWKERCVRRQKRPQGRLKTRILSEVHFRSHSNGGTTDSKIFYGLMDMIRLSVSIGDILFPNLNMKI